MNSKTEHESKPADMNIEAVIELLYKMADDQLIIGHRNSEWTGLGPMLEEDIAFSSMAQDKIGQSYVLYKILNQLGEAEPDIVAFSRNAEQFHNCQLVELPISDYGFSLIRHFLFDRAEELRFQSLTQSSIEEIAQISRKFTGEIKYHVMHADAFIRKLGTGTNESIERLQAGLDQALPFALGIFEKSPYETELIDLKVYPGEEALKDRWIAAIQKILAETDLNVPEMSDLKPVMGGRNGEHSDHLQPLLDEMSEVIALDPGADW